MRRTIELKSFVLIGVICFGLIGVGYFLKYAVVHNLFGVMDKVAFVVMEKEEEKEKKGLQQRVVDGVTVYYPKNREDLMETITKSINKGIHINEKIFGQSMNYDTEMIFLDDKTLFKNLGGLEMHNGLYGPLTNSAFILIPSEIDFQFEDVIVHELNHYVFHQYCKELGVQMEDIPTWINEGVAEYAENYGLSVEISTLNITPFINLSNSDRFRNQNESYDAYKQSFFGTRNIIRQYGMKGIEDILLRMKKEGFDKAFEQVTSVPLNEYHTQFLNQAKEI